MPDVEIVEMTPAETEWQLWVTSQDVDTGGRCTCGHEGLGIDWHLAACMGVSYALRRKVRDQFAASGRVRELHREAIYEGDLHPRPTCTECRGGTEWPCPTLAALDGDGDGAVMDDDRTRDARGLDVDTEWLREWSAGECEYPPKTLREDVGALLTVAEAVQAYLSGGRSTAGLRGLCVADETLRGLTVQDGE